ncbi:MAG: 5'-3' exonuclease [Mycoplasmataceae bacterium]|jgi:DNA polymerase-1|nr:5'-3' exonuclease [Mycoplasmataceae bacterium]
MKAIVIDGNSLVYRMFYASYNQLEYYKKNNFQPANALKLVLLVVLKLINNTKYDFSLVAFDSGKKTLRHDMFSDYKKNRPMMPEELASQMPLIEEAIETLGIRAFKIDRIEADDIIGSFSKIMNNDNVEVDIYSSDKDMLQLVNNLTTVNLFKTGISDILSINEQNITQHYHGLTPKQVIDFKAISGDASDNIPGIKGIGPTTASKLIVQYGSIESIYSHIEEITGTLKEKLILNKDIAFLSKQIATIDTNILNDDSIYNFVNKGIDKEKLNKIITRHHFTGFDKYII